MSCNRGPKHHTSSFLALSCVGFIASALASPAIANPATASPDAAAAQPDAPTRLKGVTVTDSDVNEGYAVDALASPKATAALVDTPRTVNVVTAQVLQDTASFSLQDALRTVPGITLGAGEGGTASADIPMIRGVDATADTYVDGARDVGSQTRETFDIERIEVFKGPNSAFGGRGSAGGAINIVSKLAREGTFANAQATVGTDNLYRVTADVNAQVGKQTAVRMTALYHDADIPGRNDVHDQRWGIAPSVTFGFGTPATATLAYYHYETSSTPDYGIPLTSPGQLPGGVRKPADVDYDNFYGLNDRDFQKTRADAITFKFTGDLGNGWSLDDTARYANSRNDYIVTNPDDSGGNIPNGYVFRGVKSRNSLSRGLINNLNLSGVFQTGGIGHSLSMGVEASWADSYNRNYAVDTGPDKVCTPDMLASFNCTSLADPDPSDPWMGSIAPSATPSKASSSDVSLYAFDTVTIVPQLLLNGGVRWTSYSASGTGTSRGVPYAASNAADFWTWQGAVLFKPTEDSTFYVSYADSATPPGSSVGEGSDNISGTNGNYKPQGAKNYEVGAKTELFGGGLLLTAALYQTDRSNIVDNDPIAGELLVANKARLRGFELGATGKLGPVSLVAGYTLVDSAIRDGSADDGNALPNTPKHNVAVTADWAVTPRLSLGGGAYGASGRYADTANLIQAAGYVRFDANAAYQLTDRVGLRLNVQNIGDKRYIIKLRNPHFAVPAAGRQALLSLDVRY